MSDLKKLTKAFKALAHPNRLQIYQEIMRHHAEQRGAHYDDSGCSLAAFVSCLNVGAPTVSHHLKELVNADLIRVERSGKYVQCFLNPEMRDQIQEFLKS